MGKQRKTNKHMPPRVYYKNGRWRYNVAPKDRNEFGKAWITLGTSEKEALATYAKIMSDKPEPNTAGELFARYMKDVVPLKAPATQKDNEKQMKNIRSVFAKMALHAIKPTHIAQYRDIRGAKSVVQTNRELALLSHAFNKAMEWGMINANPCQGIKRLKEKARDRLPEPWEVQVLIEHSNDLIRAYIPLKIVTGVRQGDLLKIMLSDITSNGIYIKQGKTGKKQTIPLTDEVREIIRDIKIINSEKNISSMYLFCGRKGEQVTSTSFRQQWRKSMLRAIASGQLKERFTEHDLRALHATLADEQDIDAQKNLAHDDAKTTRIYLRSKKSIVIEPVAWGSKSN